MAQPSWKQLVEELSRAGYESPYLDRLRRKLDLDQAQWDLEVEVRREMASALGRAEAKVNVALLRLERIGRELDVLAAERDDTPAWRERVDARVEDFNRERRDAQRCLWELVIHREALGIRRNEILREFYPIPPKRRRCPG